MLNLFTYKFHALGDYVRTIRLFGGTDSYSTQLVGITSAIIPSIMLLIVAFKGELCHRLAKRLYGVTNRRDATGQIARHYRRTENAEMAWQQRRLSQKKQQDADEDADEIGRAHV